MTIATPKRLTLEEYLAYDPDDDARYELVDGILVEMGAESPLNVDIAMFLIVTFAQWVPIRQIHRGTEIVVNGNQSSTRYPDLMVLSPDCAAALSGKTRSLITWNMPTPTLVVEVVSPGDFNYERDYVEKRREYAERGISEYWLVDPQRQVVLVLTLEGQSFQEVCFTGQAAIASPTSPNLTIAAQTVLNAGR
jgi:Uma2 family endonuclease